MKTVPLKIGGRTLALAFNLNAMCELQESVPDFDLNKLADYVRTPDGLRTMITVLARQGEVLAGRIPDITKEWIGAHLSPSPQRMATVQVAVLNALAEGMRMETDDDETDETDEVLAEIKKKEPAAG